MFGKKLVLAIAIIVTSSAALGDGDIAPSKKRGLYIGLGAIANAVKFNNHENFFTGFSSPKLQPVFLNAPVYLGGNGGGGQLFGGYEFIFQNRYSLATEAFGNFASHKAKQNSATLQPFTFSSSTTAFLKLNSAGGVSVLPGFIPNPFTTFYGRIGWVFSSVNRARSGLLPSSGQGIFVGIPVSNSKNANGLQLGLGINARVSKTISIRAEYDWEKYRRTNFFISTIFYNQIVGNVLTSEFLSGHASAKTTVQRFALAVVYHF